MTGSRACSNADSPPSSSRPIHDEIVVGLSRNRSLREQKPGRHQPNNMTGADSSSYVGKYSRPVTPTKRARSRGFTTLEPLSHSLGRIRPNRLYNRQVRSPPASSKTRHKRPVTDDLGSDSGIPRGIGTSIATIIVWASLVPSFATGREFPNSEVGFPV